MIRRAAEAFISHLIRSLTSAHVTPPSPPGKFIMTASSDTTILIWNLKGQVLSTINTNHMNNTYAAISPCSR